MTHGEAFPRCLRDLKILSLRNPVRLFPSGPGKIPLFVGIPSAEFRPFATRFHIPWRGDQGFDREAFRTCFPNRYIEGCLRGGQI